MLEGLSVVIPCYNEEGALESVVREVVPAAAKCARNYELVIVDDGSRDRSAEIAGRLEREFPSVRLVRHEKNRGFGAAFRTGVSAVRYEHLTLVPADGQFPAEDLLRFLPQADADIVAGFRVNRPDPVRRRITTTIFYMVMFFAFGIVLRDINWVKLYRRRVFEIAKPGFAGIGIDAEIVVRAAKAGLKLSQVRVGYRERTTGRSTGDDPRRVKQTLLELMKLGWDS
ncbi:MAG: glycosyltransferase family 2 protein [Planctomycetaceae bacterium]|nr:glycosyltransferase family 2 protein [Planctomycetaceae bacterium]